MSLKFKTIKKDRLFYEKFEYSIGFDLNEASCLRSLDHGSIDNIIERRKQWQEIARQRWVNGKQNHGTMFQQRWRVITEKTVEDLHCVAELLMQHKSEFKSVVSFNQCHVYTNDLDLINIIDRLDFISHKTYNRAIISRAKNTIQIKKSQHQFRTYLKSCKISSQQKDHLADFLHNQQSQLRISPAFGRWLDQPFERTQDYFFVDHGSHTLLTMLCLVCPGIVRKTMHIIPAK